MEHHRKCLELEITDLVITMIEHPQLKLYHFQPQTLKHVEIIKVSDKPTYDTSLERS